MAKQQPTRFAPVGSLVLSGYWGNVDLVLGHVDGPFGPSVKVIGVEHPEQRHAHHMLGRVRVHATRLDRRDRVVGTVKQSVVDAVLANDAAYPWEVACQVGTGNPNAQGMS